MPVPPPWWGDVPWWEDPEWSAQRDYAPSSVRAAVDVLRRHFDRAWWQHLFTEPEPNLVAAQLMGKGTMALDFIVQFGGELLSLESAPGVQRKIADLKGRKSKSAVLELEIAAGFAQAGMDVSFPLEGQATPTPDILVKSSSDPDVAVECKWLEPEKWELWASELARGALHLPPDADSRKMTVQITLNPRLSEIRTDDESFNEAIQVAINERIHAAIAAAIRDAPGLPFEFDIPGLGSGRLGHVGDGEYSEIIGVEISAVGQLRRLLANGFSRAVGQLPRNLAGIVVVQCEHLPEPQFARLVFDTVTTLRRHELDHVHALVVLPVRYLGANRQPMLLPNHYVRSKASLHAMDVIRRQLQPVEF